MTDLRSAFRTLAHTPGFTLTAIVTLAAGVAANTTVFTLLNGVALRAIAAPDPERLVRIYPLDVSGRRENLFPYADYLALRIAVQGLRDVVGYIPQTVTLRGDIAGGSSEPREALAYLVSGNYFPTLGATTSIGRVLRPEDDEPGNSELAAAISHRLWQRMGGRSDVLGRALAVNDLTFTVVGVVASGFVGTEPLVPDVWIPLSAARRLRPGADRDPVDGVLLLGRLGAGVQSEVAESQMSATVRGLTEARSSELRRTGVTLRRATFFPVDRDPLAVVVLMMLVTSLLLAVTAANVTNLLLARALARRREIAVRLAIGASRLRIARQLLLESLCLVLAAGALGLMLSTWTLSALAVLAGPWLPSQWGTVVLDLTPDAHVFGWTCVLCLAATLVVGLAPALQATRVSLSAALHGVVPMFGTRAGSTSTRALMVSTQVAISLALAIVAGLLGRAAKRAEALDLGFVPGHVLTTDYDLARHGYSAGRAAAFSQRLAERAGALPSVSQAMLASHAPLTGGLRTTRVWRPERVDLSPPAATRFVFESGGYFRALAIPLVRGRDIDPAAHSGGRAEAVVSEIVAARLWSGGNPVGARVRTALSATEYEVVGVARDTRASSLWRDKEAAIYMAPATDEQAAVMRLVVVGLNDSAAADVARLARSLEPDVAFSVTPLTDAVALWTLPSRAAGAASAAIALIALLVASFGLYSVVAHLLAQQTREFGIRHALGATDRDLVRESLGRGFRLVVPGLVGGLLLAQALARGIAAFLYDLSPSDAFTYLAATLVVSLSALGACYLPARRAAAVDPITVLRLE